MILRNRLLVLSLLCAGSLVVACSDVDDADPNVVDDVADDTAATDVGADVDNEVAEPDAGSDVAADVPDDVPTVIAVGRCDYTNPFSSAAECKEYVGSDWNAEDAAENCAGDTVGSGMVFVPGERCVFESELGRCAVGDVAVDGYTIVLSGADVADCAISQTACETFIGGTFAPSEVCEDAGPVTPPQPAGVFIPPTLECVPALEGEPEGASDGEVCTWTMISGCTEPGRRYVDYAACDDVLTQRPYYGFDYGVETPTDDPRLEDDEYMGEVAWVREQVEACACVCCHSTEAAPRGPSGWYIEADPIWTDTIPDSGVAMLAGIVDSTALGAYPPSQNNGFDRDVAGLPTTDVERMQKFFLDEWLRRGLTDDDAAEIPPFGGPLVTQRDYTPTACTGTVGVDAEGLLDWGAGAARYVYVMEKDSANPGVPPNLDLPAGTIWHVAMAPTADPLSSGLRYGDVPEGATQRVPGEGTAPALQSGAEYYLYVLLDIAVPLARCIFVAP
jgi:hypothetical protein